MARIATPIDVRVFMDGKSRETIPVITRAMTDSVQSGIDALNEKNDAPGGQMLG